MIDTHCHLTYAGLHERVQQVIEHAAAAGVDRMISVGTSPDDAQRAVALADRFAQVHASVGLHPHYANDWRERDALLAPMRVLAQHERVVAVGEMGLDYHYPEPARDVQVCAFAWQLDFVRDLDATGRVLPIVIHNREATDDVLAMIRESGLPGERFVFHCFTGSAAELDKILALGARVSFTGIVTFSSARDLAAASDRVPIERLMVETDSPYLTPEPHRKVRPNEPKYVADVARFLAARRNMTFEQFTEQVDANAVRFFNLR